MLEKLKKQMRNVSDDEFFDTIPFGALRLDVNQRKAIEFIFWLVYMSEQDLTDAIIESVEFSNKYSPVVTDELYEYIRESYKIDFKLLSKDYINDTMNFGGKLTIYRWLFGKNELHEILDKIKRLRDNIDHLRINNLFYKEQSIFDRKTLELLLSDYFQSLENQDLSKSRIWNGLTNSEKSRIEAIVKKELGGR